MYGRKSRKINLEFQDWISSAFSNKLMLSIFLQRVNASCEELHVQLVTEGYQITLCCGGTVIITIITGTLLCHDSISRRELMLLRERQSRRLKQPCFIKQMHTTRSSANNDITDIQQKRSALVFLPCSHQRLPLWMPVLRPSMRKEKKTNDAFIGRDGYNIEM